MIKFPKKTGPGGVPELPKKATAQPSTPEPRASESTRTRPHPKDDFQPAGGAPRAPGGGIATSQARLVTLTARKSDLELHIQQVNQSRLQLANLTSGLSTQLAKLDPSASAARLLQARIKSIQDVDKGLAQDAKRSDMQGSAIQTEIEALQKVLSKNLESSLKTTG